MLDDEDEDDDISKPTYVDAPYQIVAEYDTGFVENNFP